MNDCGGCHTRCMQVVASQVISVPANASFNMFPIALTPEYTCECEGITPGSDPNIDCGDMPSMCLLLMYTYTFTCRITCDSFQQQCSLLCSACSHLRSLRCRVLLWAYRTRDSQRRLRLLGGVYTTWVSILAQVDVNTLGFCVTQRTLFDPSALWSHPAGW
jgi:hypothetical protein